MSKRKKKLQTLELTLTNNSDKTLSVDILKGLSYVCLPDKMECISIDGNAGATSYDMILTEINAGNPIVIKKLKVIASKPEQLRKPMKFVRSTMTGALNSNYVTPSKYVSARQAQANIVDLKFKKGKIINAKRHVTYSLKPKTTVNLVLSFYFKYNSFVGGKSRSYCGIIY